MADIQHMYNSQYTVLPGAIFALGGRPQASGTSVASNPLWDDRNVGLFYSPDAQAFDQRLKNVFIDWESLQRALSVEVAGEPEVDYTYMERACAAAQDAPGMRLTVSQARAYEGISDFSYTLEQDE